MASLAVGSLSCFFLHRKAGRLGWPMVAAVVRVAIAAGGGWLAVKFLGGSDALFISLAIALVIFGGINASAITGGVWFGRKAFCGGPNSAIVIEEPVPMSPTGHTPRYLDELNPGLVMCSDPLGELLDMEDIRRAGFAPVRSATVPSR